MEIEVRADDTVYISGYVNAVERESRPVITPYGKVNELVEAGVFQRALDKVGDIKLTIDHYADKIIASISGKNLKLFEDNIGLRAVAEIKDEYVLKNARAGKIKGWSFGMTDIKDEVEQRAEKLPLRRIKDLSLDHITLVITKQPVYSATSVELRADAEADIESRCFDMTVDIKGEQRAEPICYEVYEQKIKKIKGE